MHILALRRLANYGEYENGILRHLAEERFGSTHVVSSFVAGEFRPRWYCSSVPWFHSVPSASVVCVVFSRQQAAECPD